jgi:very-long-chain enoyl-CoA reductase
MLPDVALTSAVAAKKPIKRLPNTVEVTDKTTVQDVRNSLAKQIGGMDPNRLGLFDSKNKILKDRLALVKQNKELIAGKEILVKDLGG